MRGVRLLIQYLQDVDLEFPRHRERAVKGAKGEWHLNGGRTSVKRGIWICRGKGVRGKDEGSWDLQRIPGLKTKRESSPGGRGTSKGPWVATAQQRHVGCRQ